MVIPYGAMGKNLKKTAAKAKKPVAKVVAPTPKAAPFFTPPGMAMGKK